LCFTVHFTGPSPHPALFADTSLEREMPTKQWVWGASRHKQDDRRGFRACRLHCEAARCAERRRWVEISSASDRTCHTSHSRASLWQVVARAWQRAPAANRLPIIGLARLETHPGWQTHESHPSAFAGWPRKPGQAGQRSAKSRGTPA
jgi:hypothetical protein